MKERFEALKSIFREEGLSSISRRYFISNGFDGTLTSIGITVGSLLSGVPDGITVVKIGAGAAVGLSTSGVWSVWEIEKAERRAELQTVEEAMLEDLKETKLEKRKERARKVNAVMSGLGPLIGILIPLVPFLFEGSYLTLFEATVISVGIGVGILFIFGAYMGSISDQNWYKAGLRMGVAGLVVAIINIFLPG